MRRRHHRRGVESGSADAGFTARGNAPRGQGRLVEEKLLVGLAESMVAQCKERDTAPSVVAAKPYGP